MNAKKDSVISRKIKELLRFDKQKFFELLKIIQFSILYIIFTIVLAHIIDVIFFNPYEDIKNQSKFKLFWEITLQTIACVIAIYYIRKIVKAIPFIFQHKLDDDWESVYNGEIVVSFIFIGSQQNLLKKISHVVTAS